MDLLFIMAHWHGLAKLRLHTDDTLAHLDKLTTLLGEQLRKFQKKTCSAFHTKELPKETSARNRRQISQAAKLSGKGKGKVDTLPSENQPSKPFFVKLDSKAKTFSLNTYKNHALGDYADTIRKTGTVDSFSTESVSVLLPNLRKSSPPARVNSSTKPPRQDTAEQVKRNL